MDRELSELLVSFLLGIAIFGAIGAFIDKVKNGTHRGFWLGVLLGPLGLIIAAILPGRPKDQEIISDKDGVFPVPQRQYRIARPRRRVAISDGMALVPAPRVMVRDFPDEPAPLRPVALPGRMTITCACGSRIDLGGLSVGRYACAACGGHIELEV